MRNFLVLEEIPFVDKLLTLQDKVETLSVTSLLSFPVK